MPIRTVPEAADPQFLSERVLDAGDGILETTVGVRVWCRMVAVTGVTEGGAGPFALKTGVGMG
jgi:hypothetical protein